MARVCDSSDVLSCLDERELWRGAVLIREKKVASTATHRTYKALKEQTGSL